MNPKELERLLRKNQGEMAALEGNLLSASSGKSPKTILVTSCRRGEGKTTAAMTLACGLGKNASGGVLVIDGNASSPTLHQAVGVSREPGLKEAVSGDASESQVIHQTDHPGVSVLPFGGSVSNVADLFESDGFRRLIEALKSRFEYVIMDGDSVLSSSETSVIASYFDGTVLVAECEKTKWEVLEVAQDKISRLGGNVLGVILNKRRYYVPDFLYGKI